MVLVLITSTSSKDLGGSAQTHQSAALIHLILMMMKGNANIYTSAFARYISMGVYKRHMRKCDSVVPRSRFLGDTSAPLPEFQKDICKIWGTHQIHLSFTCKIENSFPEISVHF